MDKKAISADPLAQLLDSGEEAELRYQHFFEENPDYLLIPELMHNHGLHLNAVISQFCIDPALKCDFAFLTKSSMEWRLVLVEIERPYQQIFTKVRPPQPTEKMTKGLAQISSWKTHMETGLEQVRNRLKPLLQPLGSNPIKVCYVLVIGRDSNDLTDAGRGWLRNQTSPDFKIYSYMSLVRYFLIRGKNSFPANVIRLDKHAFRFLKIGSAPMDHLYFAQPDELTFTSDDKLKLAGFNIDSDRWERKEPWFKNPTGDWVFPYS
ncbi:hypothetical protein ABS71_01925 [bacterium SCN 62-11]|nr:MAG: hypothetical protein ABS71_01925 [bacterium SCN 62-11]